MKPLYVQPRALELIVAGDGQRFTDIIRSWASVYFRRVKLAKQLLNDPLPAIREWAEGFLQQSERMYGEALRTRDLDEAKRATGD